jgi:sRNA-binding carbon storage regulator CsrA
LLIISRKIGESLIIGDNLRITVLNIQEKCIQLGLGPLEDKSMLSVSTLNLDERLKVGKDLTIMAVQIRGKQAKIGINSQRDIQILRGELYKKNRDAY